MSLEDEVQKVLRWPKWVRTDDDVQLIHEYRARLVTEARSILEQAESRGRWAPEETNQFDRLQDRYRQLGSEIPE